MKTCIFRNNLYRKASAKLKLFSIKAKVEMHRNLINSIKYAITRFRISEILRILNDNMINTFISNFTLLFKGVPVILIYIYLISTNFPSIFEFFTKAYAVLQCSKLILRIFMNVHEFLSFFFTIWEFFVGRRAETFSYQQVWELFGSYFGMQYASPAHSLRDPLKCKLSIIERTLIVKLSGIKGM